MGFATYILRKVKLIQDLSFIINTNKKEFVEDLSGIITDPQTILTEQFGYKNKVFVGYILEDEIQLRPKKKLFSFGLYYLSSYRANYVERENKIFIDGNIGVGNKNVVIFSYSLIGVAYIIMLSTVLIQFQPLALLFILIHCAILNGIIYLILRNGITKAKLIFEDEFSLMNKPMLN